jgi:AraC-like DNA-binding protein
VCTPLDALAVDASAPYRMRRFACDQVTSIVIIPKTIALATGACTLPLPQLIALRRLLAQRGAGADVSLAIEELCATLPLNSNRRAIDQAHRGTSASALSSASASASASTSASASASFAGAGASTHRTQRAVRTAQAYLYEHATERISLATLAAAAHISPFHLARAFKRESGVTLHQRQLQVRMLHAVDRINDGETDLTTLAHALGFSSHAHFSACFREHVGTSPSAYRVARH